MCITEGKFVLYRTFSRDIMSIFTKWGSLSTSLGDIPRDSSPPIHRWVHSSEKAWVTMRRGSENSGISVVDSSELLWKSITA